MESRYFSFFEKRKWLGHTARILSVKGLAANLLVLYAMVFGNVHAWMSNLLLIHFDISTLFLTSPLLIALQILYFIYAAIDNIFGIMKGCIRPIAGFVIERIFFFMKGLFFVGRK